MISTEAVQRDMEEVDVLRRGEIAKEQIEGIKGDLLSDDRFVRAGGKAMFEDARHGWDYVSYRRHSDYLTVRIEKRARAQTLVVISHENSEQIERGEVRAVHLGVFSDFSGRPNGAISYRYHPQHMTESPQLEGIVVHTNTSSAVDSVADFRKDVLQTN